MIEDITDLSNIISFDLCGNEIIFNDCDIQMIINQTNYTREEAKNKLLELKEPILVIKDYLNPIDKKNNNNSNNNKSLTSNNVSYFWAI